MRFSHGKKKKVMRKFYSYAYINACFFYDENEKLSKSTLGMPELHVYSLYGCW